MTALPCAASATCSAYLPYAGFYTTCNKTTIPFDLPLDGKSNATMDAPIFASSISWDINNPNDIALRAQWKSAEVDGTQPCTGSYEVRECRMQAAVMNQSIFISSTVRQTVDGPAPARYQLILDPASDASSDKMIRILPVHPGEGKTNTTYGGLVASLSNYLSGSVNLSYVNGNASIRSSGLYASLASISLPTADQFPGSTISQCNYTAGGGLVADFSDSMINSIRSLFW
jgi:hypothetical protein